MRTSPMNFKSPSSYDKYQITETPTGIRILTSIMIIVTLVGAFWAGLFPIRGANDPWWHLKTGQVVWNYFMENGFLTFHPYDVFTYTGATTPWVNHEWLSDLLFYGAYCMGDIQGAIIFKALIFALTIALLILYMVRNGASWKMACLGSVMILFACQTSLYLRPPIFTYLFIVIFLHIILSFQLDEYFKWAFVGAIIAEIVWVNLHGGAVIGILLIFFWWLSELWCCLINWLQENPTTPSFKRLGTASIILGAVSLASFVNPFTYHIHLLPTKVMGDRWLMSHIGELQSANMHYTNAFELIILGLFLLPMLRAGSIWVYECLAIIFFGHQALNHMRHIPLFAIVAVPPLISALAEERRALMPPERDDIDYKGFWGKLSKAVKWMLNRHVDIVIAFILVCCVFGLRPGKIWEVNYSFFPYLTQDGYTPAKYPVGAANFIDRYEPSGKMFNHDNFAGYLIWRFAPEKYKIFTDSRYDLWGSRLAKEELAVISAKEIPLGGFLKNGDWREFPNTLKKEDIKFLQEKSGDGPVFPDLVDWLESGKPYWQYLLDDKYDINFIITWDNDPIHYYFRKQFMGWFLVFHEPGYVIYLRDKPENDELLNQFALNHKEHLRKN